MRRNNGVELQRILAEHERLTAGAIGKSWNGYRGMVFVNLLCDYLQSGVPDHVGLVRRGWIEGCPNELDLMLVKKDSSPIGSSPAYNRPDVFCTIEVKASGIFWRLDEAERQLKALARKLESETGKPFAYVTRYENEKLSDITKRALGEKAFILTSGGIKTPRLHEGELPRLRQFVDDMCWRGRCECANGA